MPDLFDQSSDQMTHWAPQPNPVHPLIGAIAQYLQSGINLNPVHNPGTMPADYLRELYRNPDILAQNVQQASNFNFGGMARPSFWSKFPAKAARADEMLQQGHSIQAIADDVGEATSSVHSYFKQTGQKTAAAENPSSWTPEREAGLVEDYGKGMSQPALAKKYELSPGAIHSKLMNLSDRGEVDYVKRGPSFREDIPRQAKFIEDVGQGYSHGELARMHDVDPRTPGKWIAQLQEEGELQGYAPQGGTRTPSMPQFGFTAKEAPAVDPEMAKAMIEFLMKSGQMGAQ